MTFRSVGLEIGSDMEDGAQSYLSLQSLRCASIMELNDKKKIIKR